MNRVACLFFLLSKDQVQIILLAPGDACTETRQPINYGSLTVSSMKFNGMCPEWVLKCFSAPF